MNNICIDQEWTRSHIYLVDYDVLSETYFAGLGREGCTVKVRRYVIPDMKIADTGKGHTPISVFDAYSTSDCHVAASRIFI